MSIPLPLPVPWLDPIHYPESDGEPMAESDFQREYIAYAVSALRAHFRARPDVYVSGNLLLYYVEGDPRQVVAPDCFVVFGVSGHDRPIYKLWEEGQAPAFVLEVTSRTTRAQDNGPKRGLYAYLGVREYWQYDPTADYLDPPLQGWALAGDGYRSLPSGLPGGRDYRLWSEALGLELHLRAGQLRFRDPETGRFLPTLEEADAARAAAERQTGQERQRADQERQRAEQASQRAARLAERLRALGIDPDAEDR